MSPLETGLAGFAALTLLIYAGMHISTALLLVSFVGISLIRGDWALAGQMLGQTATDAVTEYEFGTAPLFVLMGFMVMAAGIGRDSYIVAERMFGRLRGGIGQATVVGNAIFSAVTGVSIAAVVMFTRMAVPEMLRRGYPERLAVGVVAGSAMLGMLIPPSVLMIIYAVITETSIGDMYNAGLVPGVILSAAFMVTIWVVAGRHPGMKAAAQAVRSESGDLSHTRLLRMMVPIGLLMLLVLGGMYAGLFTATEAGAVGAAGATLIALARRALTPRSFWQILIDTGYVTASIVLIIASAAMFTRFLAISGLPSYMSQWITTHQFTLLSVMLVYILVVLVLGTALDSVSTVLIAVPVFAPVFKDMGADLVWVGIITMITVEIGIITPPLGISPFIVKSTLDADGLGHRISLNDIYWGALPFAAAALVVVGLIVVWPPLALWFK
ncbi:MAG: TRAP transporter large permease [Ramlibacter sp.]|uniref:TRAP transporter large permease n=1 Tax=Ramlibacter sp. TaxID=1917967 RepID=UPI0026390813|nr:TRAP transporter large permease [Ramlibacter sp.]MDH4376106.1 TRAP transporter large permease [Ramlibacter sp.]